MALIGSGLALSGSAGAAPVAPNVYVGAAAITAPPTGPSDPYWYFDGSGTGAQTVAADSFDGTSALKLSIPTAANVSTVARAFPVNARPTNLPALLAGASYSYSGKINVNFQSLVYFVPKDAQYGPTGSSPCAQAKDNSQAIPNTCYAVIKWEPLAFSANAWTDVDLSQDLPLTQTAGGWMNTKRVGKYPAPGAQQGFTLTQYLGEMASYSVVSLGVSVGSRSVGSDPDGWVRSIRFGGNTYRFGAAPVQTFPDVPTTGAFFDEIAWLSTSGATTGYTDGSFRPNENVSRQAFIAFAYRLKHPGGVRPTCTVAPFTDVPVTNAFCGEIAWAKSSGISVGFADGTFQPGALIQRGASMAFLYRLSHAGVTTLPSCTQKPFDDVTVPSEFCGVINWAKTAGITTGNTDGTFRPAGPVTRAASAAFLYRIFAG
ncbi:S-layer homology domain-containing protein [Nakamurella silvestris]|nr:S-layer homology domain-containing protein [Nakamurella silvestris]